jgi:hypothetical protein
MLDRAVVAGVREGMDADFELYLFEPIHGDVRAFTSVDHGPKLDLDGHQVPQRPLQMWTIIGQDLAVVSWLRSIRRRSTHQIQVAFGVPPTPVHAKQGTSRRRG